ncbi:17425_t:CDS:2 [Dentiscutata erythropus]|uniref:17425_t:CDS:1 n=1 Tax=Dentiscutata erythropus TaxID=1348616 RepID=A0A9N9N9P7_9GLOM|nr:17425_t:CDS:2 [Dentiscutata erythropus]
MCVPLEPIKLPEFENNILEDVDMARTARFSLEMEPEIELGMKLDFFRHSMVFRFFGHSRVELGFWM